MSSQLPSIYSYRTQGGSFSPGPSSAAGYSLMEPYITAPSYSYSTGRQAGAAGGYLSLSPPSLCFSTTKRPQPSPHPAQPYGQRHIWENFLETLGGRLPVLSPSTSYTQSFFLSDFSVQLNYLILYPMWLKASNDI